MNLTGIIKAVNKDKLFWSLMVLVFILQMITYPSVHHISDEEAYLDIAKNVCKLDFSDFFGKKPIETIQHNTPIYPIALCLTSPFHGYNIERSEITTYLFFILLVVGWYFSIPEKWKVNKKMFILLLFVNSLLWVYSFRVLIDVPLAFFLSLGMFNLYLFYQYKQKRNYYWAFILLSLALLTKESAVLFLPIFSIYLILKKEWNIKSWVLLGLPFVPFVAFSVIQYLTEFPVLYIFLGTSLKPTYIQEYGKAIPYTQLPTILFIIGIFGPGIILLASALKNIRQEIKNFILFSIILYVFWEIVFDFVLFANIPRYHTAIMPFLTLIISEAARSKKLKYVYWITFLYVLIIGFAAAYYFSVSSLEIWKVSPLKDIFNLISKIKK